MDMQSKADKLLAKMTLEEKIGQLVQRGTTNPRKLETVRDYIRAGKIGSLLNTGSVQQANEMQRTAVEESRLGIPLLIGHDAIHGFRTTFPIPLAESCSWNVKLMEETAAVSAKETASMGIRWTFAPMVDIARDPRWGRIAEGAGEDPYLGSAIAKARISGFQRPNKYGFQTIAACAKHFAGYGAAEGGRDYNTAEISETTLRNVYLPPFQAAVEAGADTFMCAFQDISGTPATAHGKLLRDILVGEWEYDGFVVSDWGSIQELVTHGVAEDLKEAASLAARSGIHMDMHADAYLEHLAELVQCGSVPISVIDDAVRRVLSIKLRLGLFEHPYTDEEAHKHIWRKSEHIALARQAAAESFVLLKNEQELLPLKPELQNIAVIGPLADSPAVIGCWESWGPWEEVVTVLTGIRERAWNKVEVRYAQGASVTGSDEDEDLAAEALQLASAADAIVLVLGEGMELSGENRNRSSLELPGNQQRLLEQMHALGKPIILVIASGRPLSISWAKEHIPAILMIWHPGCEAGHAAADVLFGDSSPSGKLTVTVPRTVGQVPIYYNHKRTGRPEQQKYEDCPATPLYPFGYGLTYTTFDYNDMALSTSQLGMQETLEVSVRVSNTGIRPGEEIVQLYICDVQASIARPVKELKGFAKHVFAPGESRTITFFLTADDLGYYDASGRYVVEPGEFKVWIGPNSAEGLECSFRLIG